MTLTYAYLIKISISLQNVNPIVQWTQKLLKYSKLFLNFGNFYSFKLQLKFHLITSCIICLSFKTLFSFYAQIIVDGFNFLAVRIYSSPALPYHLTRIVCSSITFIRSMSALYSLDRNPLYLLRLVLYSFPPAFISLPVSLAKLRSAIDAPQNNCLHFGAPAGNFIWMRWDFPEGAELGVA